MSKLARFPWGHLTIVAGVAWLGACGSDAADSASQSADGSVIDASVDRSNATGSGGTIGPTGDDGAVAEHQEGAAPADVAANDGNLVDVRSNDADSSDTGVTQDASDSATPDAAAPDA